jgi:hypothetical protein
MPAMRLALVLLLVLPLPAAADTLLGFQSPSGNIHCLIATGAWPAARCDILEATRSFTGRPADCDLDWGHAFAVGLQGPGQPVCAGDIVADPGNPALTYGDSISLGGFTCTSLDTGMTCTNSQGHGFTLARAGQQVF